MIVDKLTKITSKFKGKKSFKTSLPALNLERIKKRLKEITKLKRIKPLQPKFSSPIRDIGLPSARKSGKSFSERKVDTISAILMEMNAINNFITTYIIGYGVKEVRK